MLTANRSHVATLLPTCWCQLSLMSRVWCWASVQILQYTSMQYTVYLQSYAWISTGWLLSITGNIWQRLLSPEYLLSRLKPLQLPWPTLFTCSVVPPLSLRSQVGDHWWWEVSTLSFLTAVSALHSALQFAIRVSLNALMHSKQVSVRKKANGNTACNRMMSSTHKELCLVLSGTFYSVKFNLLAPSGGQTVMETVSRFPATLIWENKSWVPPTSFFRQSFPSRQAPL